jgi:Ca2+-binding RTX toxin-like protein
MAHKLNQHYFYQFDFNLSNDSWILGRNAVISSNTYGLYGDSGFNNIDVTVKGRIWATDTAILAKGDNIDVVVETTGQLSGDSGIVLRGAHGSVRNAGDIFGTNGIVADGDAIKIINTGLVNATSLGISTSLASDTFINGKSGEVYSGIIALQIAGNTIDGVSRTINHGLIVGNSYAFESGRANDRLINDGKMSGDIYTGDGNDTIDTRGGTINGRISTGLGNDKLYTDSASHKLTESAGEGLDTVYSTVSYKLSDYVEVLRLIGEKDINGTGTSAGDDLHGNSGDNVLKGLAGIDNFWGHKGNDKLYGGANLDTFIFGTGDGKDVIMDFEDGIDKLSLFDWKAITSFADLRNNHATNQGDDLLLHAGSDSILIKNFHKADLDPTDVYM